MKAELHQKLQEAVERTIQQSITELTCPVDGGDTALTMHHLEDAVWKVKLLDMYYIALANHRHRFNKIAERLGGLRGGAVLEGTDD